jgi:hypothetical protein
MVTDAGDHSAAFWRLGLSGFREASLGDIKVPSAVGYRNSAGGAARNKVKFGIGQFVMLRGFDLFKHLLAPSHWADGFGAVDVIQSTRAASHSVMKITNNSVRPDVSGITVAMKVAVICLGHKTKP